MSEEKNKILKNNIGIILYGAILAGVTAGLVRSRIYNTDIPYTAVKNDVNKDGIEDIVLYNSKGNPVYTMIGMQDSSKTITYVEAMDLMKNKFFEVNNAEILNEQKCDSIKHSYEKQKSDLTNAMHRYNKTGVYNQ